MAVAYDTSGVDAPNNFGVTSCTTASFTIAATADRAACMFLGMAGNGSTNFSGSVAGTSGSAISGTDTTTARTPRCLMWGVTAPASGSQTGTMSWTTAQDAVLGVTVFNGVDQTTPFNNGTTANAATGAPSITPTGSGGSLSVAGLNALFTPGGATQTTRVTNQDNGSHILTMTTGASGATHAWNDGFAVYVASACNVKAVPASCAITGTATGSITEADIVSGGKTIIATLTGDTYVPAVGTPTFNAATTKGTAAADSAGGGGGRTGDGTLTCTFPSGYTPTAGHFALMIVYNDQGAASTPTNWSSVTGNPFGAGTEKLYLFTKVLAGGESDPQTTISGSALNASHCANMAIYTGVGSVGAIGTASNGTGTPMTANGVTTTANNSIVCACSGRGDNENAGSQTFGGSSTGVNERLDGGTAAGNDSQVSMADITVATSGSSSGNASSTTSATDPWVSVCIELVANTPFASARQAFINGCDSAQSEGTGWDAVVKAGEAVTSVVRTSDTVVTLTLSAFGSYNITAQETITVTVPASILTGAAAVVASPTFTIDTSGGGASDAVPQAWAQYRARRNH